MDPLSTAEGDNMEDDGSELVLPPGVHDIVKHPKHGGECRKCGAVGCWDEIKSKPCPQSLGPLGKEIVATPVHEPSASKTPDLKTESLGEMLDLALKNGDETTAWDIVNKMEAKEALAIVRRSTTDVRNHGTGVGTCWGWGTIRTSQTTWRRGSTAWTGHTSFKTTFGEGRSETPATTSYTLYFFYSAIHSCSVFLGFSHWINYVQPCVASCFEN